MLDFIKLIAPEIPILGLVLLNFLVYLLLAIFTKYILFNIITYFVNKTKNSIDDNIYDIIRIPIIETIIILGGYHSTLLIDIFPKVQYYFGNLLITSIILIWTITSYRICNLIIKNIIKENTNNTLINHDNLPLIINLIKVLLILISIIAILSAWKLDLTPLLASAGILSVIIGFAAKDSIANFLGGISVIIDKPYRIGDWIELDSKERGEVVDIGLRSTRIRTRDDILISIPNSIISNAKIVNESFPYQNYRIRVPISVHFNADLELVERELTLIAENNDRVLKDPFPRVRYREFASSTINCELLCWTNQPAERGLIIHLLLKSIYQRFNELGIDFPYQQIDIKIKNKDFTNDKN